MKITRGAGRSYASRRAEFLSNLLTITGDTRLLFLPQPTDTTTSTDASLNARVITHAVSLATSNALSSLGYGYSITLDGAADYATTPDAAGLSFGTGAADSAFSIISLANTTNTAAARDIIRKFPHTDATNEEWALLVDASDKLVLYLGDDSAGVAASRASDAAITQGSWALLGATYSAATGGATAANDITFYQNGASIASTATNNASYVAMENGTATVVIGAELRLNDTAPTGYLPGSMAMLAVCQKNLTASEHWAIKELVNGYFGLAL